MKLIRTIVLLSFLFGHACYAQSYGLGFVSHEAVADKRTGLDLFPGEGMKISTPFTLSFDIGFLPEKLDYYGYIFRTISNNKNNIDLLYDIKGLDSGDASKTPHFRLIIGDHYTKINFGLTKNQLLNNWTKIILQFDAEHDRLALTVNNKTYTEEHVGIKKDGIYKILFGSNNFLSFSTQDTPPFKLRDIELQLPGKTLHWPLNEESGTLAHQENKAQNASAKNPIWIRSLHKDWRKMKSFQMMGATSVAFNRAEDQLYIINKDSIYTYQLKQNTLTATRFTAGQPSTPSSNQSCFDNVGHKLYNYFVDRDTKRVTVYDFTKKKWDNNFNYVPVIDHLHSNNFFSPADTSLYILGGYGQFKYKNTVYRYQLNKREWTTIACKGDTLFPRYLAALGTTNGGKVAYLLGGYGSKTGQQALNPQNFYDLLRFDVAKKTFKKIYELKPTGEGFTPVNSLLIDEKNKYFTTLIFSGSRYHTYLQLITGSLSQPAYRALGSKIPYDFSDNHSFADVYYSASTRQYIAVTLTKNDEQQTVVNIYTLSAPALPLEMQAAAPQSDPSRWFVLILAGILIIPIAVWVGKVLRRKAGAKKNLRQEVAVPQHQTITSDDSEEIIRVIEPQKNAIYLFGDLKIFAANGDDINRNYTSLIKELFLVIFINSIKPGRGVSPEKLLELFWMDKSDESAKNNRSANLSRLKALLSQMENVQLSKVTGSWKIEIDSEKVYADYFEYRQLVSKTKVFDKTQIKVLLSITQRGCFMADAEYQWLDQIKSEISNEIIDIYLGYANSISIETDPEFVIELANCINIFDPINEEAMLMKCKALIRLGKHSLAKTTFSTFAKEYEHLYGEKFREDFQSILEHH